MLRRYIKEYVPCHTCRSPDTILIKETRLFFLQCMTCHSTCSVQTIKTGFQVRISLSRQVWSHPADPLCFRPSRERERISRPRRNNIRARRFEKFPLEKKNIFLFYIDHKYTISEGKINIKPKCNISDFRLKFDGFSNPPPYKTISC